MMKKGARKSGRPAGSLVAISLLLTACGTVPLSSPTAPAPTVPSAVPLSTRPEPGALPPCGPLWPEGEPLTLRGLYRTSDGQGYLDLFHEQADAPPCRARLFLLNGDLGLGPVEWADPPYLEVTGQLSSERWSSLGLWDLRVEKWSSLPFDPEAVRSACREAVRVQAAALASLDWAALAMSSYYSDTLGVRPAWGDPAGLKVQILAADEVRPLFLVQIDGPELPASRPLVRRWAAVECLYDLEAGRVRSLVATIRGEVQE